MSFIDGLHISGSALSDGLGYSPAAHLATRDQQLSVRSEDPFRRRAHG